MAKVKFVGKVLVDDVVRGVWQADAERDEACDALEVLRGEARDAASQAVDQAKDAVGCKKESQDGGEDRDLGRVQDQPAAE